MGKCTITCLMFNFRTLDRELEFGDFKIISVKQGPEAAKWREKIGCKDVPRNILIKEFPDYKMLPDDITGFDGVAYSMRELLLLFRLFKPGDISFQDFLIEEEAKENKWIGSYNWGKLSGSRYHFEQSEIEAFNKFGKTITRKAGYNNRFFKFALEHFMSGVNKVLFCRAQGLERIVDYIRALESLFLIDNKMYFLTRAISERISRFLEDDTAKKTVKDMYAERSNIVHGNYIDLTEEEWAKKKSKIQPVMDRFEIIIRKVLVRLFDFNFSNKKDIVKFMEKLFDVSPDALKIMQTAKLEAEKVFKTVVTNA